MRYQSFYPFANQQRQVPAGQQQFAENFQQPRPFMPGPPQGFGQNRTNQPPGQFSANPYGMDPGMNGQSQPGGNGTPSKPEMYMETANRLISTVQQYAPIVQQFAPMIQNIPAMWKLYRGFQSLPDAGAAGSVAASAAQSAPAAAAVPRPSIPKVFQPPI
ncbi:VrrA/YqfQ family protein [Sporosarcina aquimarina]|uniref:VrrA/YqfQ family protein n=1 Tax=Sporosarcina aquimarina TaxID=114975 RepID=A0ABU4FW72_9BACL|nr:VrrA/YqfQ family protein [Sporosarcina aquimarina]MDW0108964.1 VrrA/YqfQ family protein [Sporosarcina aquimarina]